MAPDDGYFWGINQSCHRVVLRSFDCPSPYALGSFAELEAAILIPLQLSDHSARALAPICGETTHWQFDGSNGSPLLVLGHAAPQPVQLVQVVGVYVNIFRPAIWAVASVGSTMSESVEFSLDFATPHRTREGPEDLDMPHLKISRFPAMPPDRSGIALRVSKLPSARDQVVCGPVQKRLSAKSFTDAMAPSQIRES
jgi:hypothetical protein